MKKAIKVIVPLLLAIAIVFSIGWYFLKYDPNFTRDLLLQQARRLEKDGKMSAAVWFYDLAYRQSLENDQVAIELAEQFKSIGNYTKAEYTLSKAIEDGGSPELYTALCKTYVEQNKLLDAVQLLDKIGDPALRSQLESLRPKAPAASLEPGHYSQYLSVTLEAEGGSIYCSLDQEYPSLHEDAYQAPIVLSQGETTIWALTVADNGLVSSLSSFVYTVDGVIEPVTFQDSAVEAALRTQLGITEDRPLMSNELWVITEFSLPEGAVTCQDLKWLPYLEKLTIRDNVIDSLESLSGMNRLSSLLISGSVVPTRELAGIARLPALKNLQLSGCSLSTIAGLEAAVGLQELDLSDNTIRDTAPLQALHNLQALNMRHNALVSLEDIGTLTTLTVLDVSHNAIVSTAPLEALTQLTSLSLSGNGLMQLEGIATLTGLQHFEAAENKLVDISVLAGCTQLAFLDVSNNTLLDIGVVSNFPALQTLRFAYNEVTALPGFAAGCPLSVIDGSHNQLSSLEPLAYLSALQYVMMDYNGGISSIQPLVNCPALVLVNVYRTAVTAVHALTDRGVTVNYSPV